MCVRFSGHACSVNLCGRMQLQLVVADHVSLQTAIVSSKLCAIIRLDLLRACQFMQAPRREALVVPPEPIQNTQRCAATKNHWTQIIKQARIIQVAQTDQMERIVQMIQTAHRAHPISQTKITVQPIVEAATLDATQLT